jgi:hypothetical protein
MRLLSQNFNQLTKMIDLLEPFDDLFSFFDEPQLALLSPSVLQSPISIGSLQLQEFCGCTPSKTMLSTTLLSRDEQEDENYIPSTLYSSIKYRIFFSLDPAAFTTLEVSNVIVQASVIDPVLGVEVTKQGGKSMVKGSQEYTFLTKASNGRLECDQDLHFTCSSYHFPDRKKKFALQFKFSVLDKHLVKPLFTATSTLFTLFARRPPVGQRDLNKIEKQKTKTKSKTLLSVEKTLHDLVKYVDVLNGEDRTIAMENIQQTLLSLQQ